MYFNTVPIFLIHRWDAFDFRFPSTRGLGEKSTRREANSEEMTRRLGIKDKITLAMRGRNASWSELFVDTWTNAPERISFELNYKSGRPKIEGRVMYLST